MIKRELVCFGAKNLAHLFLLRENELQSLFVYILILIRSLCRCWLQQKKNSLFDIEICFKTKADATQTKMSEHIIRPFETSVT